MFNFLSDLIPPCTAILSSLGFIKTQQASIERLQSYGIFFGEIMILPSCVMISMQIKVFPAAATHFNPNFVGKRNALNKKLLSYSELSQLISFWCVWVCQNLAWHGMVAFQHSCVPTSPYLSLLPRGEEGGESAMMSLHFSSSNTQLPRTKPFICLRRCDNANC